MTYSVPVLRTSRIGEDILLLEVDTRGTPLAAQYTEVGQYVTLSTPHSPPGYFAMATAPGAEHFIFLIRIVEGNPKTMELAKLRAGDRITMSDIGGEGYPIGAQAGRHILMVASGTGIAPIRALVDSILPRRERFGRLFLVYGAAHEDALAFVEDHARWQKAGVELTISLSRPAHSWTGARGYAQDVVSTMDIVPERTSAFLCGQKVMTQRVAAVLAERGMDAARIFENN
jgi:NAD(P)H-flavin reductase